LNALLPLAAGPALQHHRHSALWQLCLPECSHSSKPLPGLIITLLQQSIEYHHLLLGDQWHSLSVSDMKIPVFKLPIFIKSAIKARWSDGFILTMLTWLTTWIERVRTWWVVGNVAKEAKSRRWRAIYSVQLSMNPCPCFSNTRWLTPWFWLCTRSKFVARGQALNTCCAGSSFEYHALIGCRRCSRDRMSL
jgi:hypothetical protein